MLFAALAISVKAQTYNNEWINFSNQYYKFPIGKTGFYRFDSLALATSGINVASLNPKNFQLFIKGKEVPLYIFGESDNYLNDTDYVEFYAEINDGQMDSALYYNITYLPNRYVSLFNDTVYAFLTWNNLTTNKRIIQETDTVVSGNTPAPYFYTERICTGKNQYNYVEEYFFGSSDPRYTQAEGYGYQIVHAATYNTNISPANIYTQTALPVNVSIHFSGCNVDDNFTANDHEIKAVVYDNTNTPIKLFDTIFKGYKYFRYNFTLQTNTLAPTSNIELSSVVNPLFPTADDKTAMHHIYIKYPQLPDVAGTPAYKLFVDDDAVFPKTYLQIGSVNTGLNGNILFYDLTNSKRIPVKMTTVAHFLVPNSGSQKVCYFAAESATIAINKLKPVNQTGYFVNHKTNDDSAFVIITARKYAVESYSYAAHRQSFNGGSHDVIVAMMDELTDQFAYGIEKHPAAIRNFCKFLLDSLPTDPRNLFLIGKSVQHRDLFAGSQGWAMADIPTMGIPAADNLLTCALTSSNYFIPEIAVGHLAAQSPLDVLNYLAKVQQHETPVIGNLPTDDWKKHVLHFAGGTDGPQQAMFEGFLNNYKAVIQDTSYGGKVFDFKKTTTAPIQITISDSVKNHFSYGVGLVNFFGHGSFTGFDQAIDDPNQYNNAGKYPFFIANSCYSGNIHTYDIISASEKFVLANQKGSIAFLAASNLGFVGQLDGYTRYIIEGLSHYRYGKSIGEVIRFAISSTNFSGQFQQFTNVDMTLHGDPALKIYSGSLPDYYIDNSRVFFDTKTYTDKVGISVDISNFGRARKDSFIVRVERYFPNGDSVVILNKIFAPYYRDTLSFFTPIDFVRGFGLNKFKVIVDAQNGIIESNEANNSTLGTVDLFLQGGDLIPVYPYKYAVIPSTPTITLKASTVDPFSGTRNYRLQLDTTDSFLTPLTSTFIASSGGVVEWTVSLPYADSTVYYWRVTKDSVSPNETFVWHESSFQCITNKRGWGQSHFFQFKDDEYQFVKFKRPLRQFAFENDVAAIYASTRRIIGPSDWLEIQYAINGSILRQWSCEWNGWVIAVLDSISGKPMLANKGVFTPAVDPVYGNYYCYPLPQPLWTYDFGASTDNSAGGNIHPNWQIDLTSFLNSIPNNHWVLAYSQQDHALSTYSPSLIAQFQSIGSASITSLKDTCNMVIFGKKGGLIGSATENISPNYSTPATIRDTITTRWRNGFVASELIGPGYKWNSFHWKVRSLDALAGDTTIVKIVGYKSNGVVDTLATFTEDSLNVLNLQNYVDANIYPHIKLIAFKKDNKFTTCPQLKYWYVLYDEAPECAINPKKGFQAINDTLQEGDNVTLILPIENVGVIPFTTDSLVITYWIEDANRVNNYLPQKLKAKPFNPGAVILDTIKIDTYKYPGNNALWVDVNPPQNARYQKEQYHFNNVARYPFSVNKDITNPLLDVTFDGVRIMNGDVVSAKPHILVNLKDENKFLALNDTTAFAVYIKKPSDLTEKRIYFGSGLIFTPASLPGNSCKIEYDPILPEDGKHVLIVQATDRSSNLSGAIDYRITFEVINKSTITQVINYPNPFSTSTRFVFNLTGSEVPEMFNIQIMTITGKIVKTIQRDELGPLHVGRNITEYAWDGKDDFGDKLANGVYLYKVQTKLNGQTIEHRSTEADAFFTKQLGKMVIMR